MTQTQQSDYIPGEILTFDAKPWWASRTIWGAMVAAIIAPLARHFGLDLAPADQAELVNIVTAMLGGIGGILAIYGRARAKQPISAAAPRAAVKMAFGLCLLVPLLGTLPACASREAETPAQMVFGIQADFAVAQHLAAAYVASPEAKPEIVAAVRRSEAAAFDAVNSAQAAVRSGADPTVPALVATARHAVAGLRHILTKEAQHVR